MRFIDMTKTRVRTFKGLRTGRSLLASGISQVGNVKVNPKLTYNGTFSIREVPKHRELIMGIIKNAKTQEELENTLAAYLVEWGKADSIKRPAQDSPGDQS